MSINSLQVVRRLTTSDHFMWPWNCCVIIFGACSGMQCAVCACFGCSYVQTLGSIDNFIDETERRVFRQPVIEQNVREVGEIESFEHDEPEDLQRAM